MQYVQISTRCYNNNAFIAHTPVQDPVQKQKLENETLSSFKITCKQIKEREAALCSVLVIHGHRLPTPASLK